MGLLLAHTNKQAHYLDMEQKTNDLLRSASNNVRVFRMSIEEKQMAWEQSHIEALIDILEPKGHVLEIGYNVFSARRIEDYKPKRHVILEQDPSLVSQGTNHCSASFIQGGWQEELKKLGKFDVIIMSQLDLSPRPIKNNTSQAKMLLQKEKDLHHLVEKEIPHLLQIQYSDEDIDAFCQTISSDQFSALSYFMSELLSKGQITQNQYNQILERYHLPKASIQNKIPLTRAKSNPLFPLLMQCLPHMEVEGRFACFINSGISNFEDPDFFDHVITNPSLEYQERAIGTPPSTSLSSLVMIVEKVMDVF